MKGPLILTGLAIFIVAILLLAFWQFGILRQETKLTVSDTERQAEEILQFLQSFDFASDFQKLREKLPAGSVKEILPFTTSEVGVFDPFGLSQQATTTE